MHLPAAGGGRDLHHIKADGGIAVGAVLQVLLGRQNQAVLLPGVHRGGGAVQHRAGAGLDLGKHDGVCLV